MSASFVVNPWITFLRQYGPIPRNDNMYDETIQRGRRRARVAPVAFPSPYHDELKRNFLSATPQSVILTGTAGDGKTYLCREVWEAVGGNLAVWEGDEKVRQIQLPGGRRLTVVKDLSELGEAERDVLVSMAASVLRPEQSQDVYLVAANDGQLVEAWNALQGTDDVLLMRQLVEDLLVNKQTNRPPHALSLYNLSGTSAADLLDRILDAVIRHEGWAGCNGCRGQNPGASDRCPIWENYTRLQDPLFRERLRNLLLLCDQNEYHLPIRQLLLLVTNTLLGHPAAKDHLLRCTDAARSVENKTAAQAPLYSNVFGENLPAARQESTQVFEVLGRFGIGEETSNRVDNLLIYGTDDELLQEQFQTLVGRDTFYGATPSYLALQSAYLEQGEWENAEEFLHALRMQRQRLFFAVAREQAPNLRLWDLTVFHFAGEYLTDVYEALRQGRSPARKIVLRLVRGMNRIFTGMLTATEQNVVLATSGSYSQARVSPIEEAEIPVAGHLGQRVSLELRDDRVQLAVYLAHDVPVRLPLHLVRFEFLSRVAEGALPSSFSRECYEDLLAYKSRLLREYQAVQRRFGAPPSDGELNLRLLRLDERGLVYSEAIELHLGD